MLKYLCHIGCVATALLTIGLTAHAAPVGTSERNLSVHNGVPLVEPAARRCWWRNGVRHCQRYGVMGTRGRTTPKRIGPVPRAGGRRWIAKTAAVAVGARRRRKPHHRWRPRYLRHILYVGGWLRLAHRRLPADGP